MAITSTPTTLANGAPNHTQPHPNINTLRYFAFLPTHGGGGYGHMQEAYNVTTPLPLPYAPLPYGHGRSNSDGYAANAAIGGGYVNANDGNYTSGNTPGGNYANGHGANGDARASSNDITSPTFSHFPPAPPNSTQTNTQENTTVPVPLFPTATKPNGASCANVGDTDHLDIQGGPVVPIHPGWTRGDLVLVARDGGVWQSYRVDSAVLAAASPLFATERGYGHTLLHETPKIIELLLAFLYLGRPGIDAAALRPTLEQYHALHSLFVCLAIRRPLCLLLRHHANSYAGDLVDSLGRNASADSVWRLFDLARLLRAEGVWNAVLDADFTSSGWRIIHDPWEARVEPHNAEAFSVLLLLHRLSAVDDAPLHEFRVGYDMNDRPYVYHQDSEAIKLPAV